MGMRMIILESFLFLFFICWAFCMYVDLQYTPGCQLHGQNM